MAITTIEEAVIKTLSNDTNIKSIIDTDIGKRIFIASVRPQIKKFPMISVDTEYGPEEPAIPALNGICTIIMEFKELQNNGKPTKYSAMSLLREHIRRALSKVDFSTGDLTINHFLMQAGSIPIFDLTDKVWRWPLIFEFVHRDSITVGRVGIVVP